MLWSRRIPSLKCIRSTQVNRPFSQKPHSNEAPIKSEKILRDHFSEYLFSTKTSFFAEKAPVYNSTPLPFNSMWGESAYREALTKEYDSAHGFLTPVEIFKPHYANAIAAYIIDQLKKQNLYGSFNDSNPFHICEIGGGNGTCLVGILDYLKENEQDLFRYTKCTCIDVSSPFIEKQKVALSNYQDKISFSNISIFKWTKLNPHQGFVIALELLDNLPHDKLVLHNGNEFKQTSVILNEKGFQEEKLDKITDPVIVEILQSLCTFYHLPPNSWVYRAGQFDQQAKLWNLLFHPSYSPEATIWETLKSFFSSLSPLGPQVRFIYLPSCSFLLFKALNQFFPNHQLILADFDGHLTNLEFDCNAPLVQKTVGNTTTEYGSYLNTKFGDNDIIFPTNFVNLAVYYSIVTGKKGKFTSTKSFMKLYADTAKTRTRSGFNPLTSDFMNTSFFFGTNEPFNFVKSDVSDVKQ